MKTAMKGTFGKTLASVYVVLKNDGTIQADKRRTFISNSIFYDKFGAKEIFMRVKQA